MVKRSGADCVFCWDSGILQNQKMRRLERPVAWELGESLVGEDLSPELK
jgi:hypothetical protein